MLAPPNTSSFDFSHSPGEANVTGTPITKTIESNINKNVNICNVAAIYPYFNLKVIGILAIFKVLYSYTVYTIRV